MGPSAYYSDDDGCFDVDDADHGLIMSPRGWSMRKGHRQRLAREQDKESTRGRARYSHRVGSGRSRRAEKLCDGSWLPRKHKSDRGGIRQSMAADVEEALDKEDWSWWSYRVPSHYATAGDWLDIYEDDIAKVKATDPAVMSEASWSNDMWSSDDEGDLLRLDASETASTASSDARVAPLRPPKWLLAEAELTAHEYFVAAAAIQSQKPKRRRRNKQKETPSYVGLRAGSLSTAARFEEPPSRGGQPSSMEMHNEALRFAGGGGSAGKGAFLHQVKEGSAEFEAVVDYFLYALNAEAATIKSLTRIENRNVQSRFLSGGGHTVMFHGCRSPDNEKSIISSGFAVSCCRSRGQGFGTWLAYNAAYSNCGYAFDDCLGWRHMFICVASYHYTVLDDVVMRVVGENCAYPQWLIQYRAPRYTLGPRNRKQGAGARRWHVVKDGRWVLEDKIFNPKQQSS